MSDQSEQVDIGKSQGMDEKTEEKQYEKMDEKTWQEKNRNDPLSRIIWAIILIWAGIVLLASNLGVFSGLPFLGDMSVWAIGFAGAGLIILGEVLIRLFVPKYSGPVVGSLIFGLILLGVAMDDVIGWAIIWPTIIIGVGVVILFRALFGKG